MLENYKKNNAVYSLPNSQSNKSLWLGLLLLDVEGF
jgi:hypothetical protein